MNENMVNKVWTQTHRTKMVSAVFEIVMEKVRNVWEKTLEKEQSALRSKVLKNSTKAIKDMVTVMSIHYKNFDKRVVKKDLEWAILNSQEALTSQTNINDKLSEMGIPHHNWHSHTDIPKIATGLMNNKIHILNNLGFVILEFLRTGHIDQWLNIVGLIEDLSEKNILKIKEDINNV